MLRFAKASRVVAGIFISIQWLSNVPWFNSTDTKESPYHHGSMFPLFWLRLQLCPGSNKKSYQNQWDSALTRFSIAEVYVGQGASTIFRKKKKGGTSVTFMHPDCQFSHLFFFSFKNDFSFLCACIFSASLNFVGGNISEILNYTFKDTEICAIKTSCISENDDQKLAISGCSNRQQDYWLF